MYFGSGTMLNNIVSLQHYLPRIWQLALLTQNEFRPSYACKLQYYIQII